MALDVNFVFSVTRSGIVVIPEHKDKFVILISASPNMNDVYIARVVPFEVVETNLDFTIPDDIEIDRPTIFPALTNKNLHYHVPKRTLESLKKLYDEVDGEPVYDPNTKLYFSKTRIPLPDNYEYIGRGYLFGKTYHMYLGGN
jgi:hypothetical protein